MPGLTRAHTPSSSPLQTTPPDDIASFTPSSHDRIRMPVKSSVSMSKMSIEGHRSSSPTPAFDLRPKASVNATVVPATSDGQEDDERIPDLMAALERERAIDAADEIRKARAERLYRVKQEALVAKAKVTTPAADANADDDDDNDFTILPDQQTPVPVRQARFDRGSSPSAKAIFGKGKASPAISKQRQDLLRRAGRSTRPRSDLTETYVEFAGKTFDHAGLRRANGGTKRAGQKNGRDVVISQQQANGLLYKSHMVQVAGVRTQKEEDFGKVRNLPQKQVRDMSALIEASAKYADRAMSRNDADEDADEEDDDFVPEDEIDEEGPLSGEDEEMGDEEIGSPQAREDAASGSDIEHIGSPIAGSAEDANKENEPASIDLMGRSGVVIEDEMEDDTPMIKRRPRPSARIATDSDDEDSAVAPRAPLAEITPQSERRTAPTPSPALDLAGFGDGGSPSFSQLFEPTQLNGPSANVSYYPMTRAVQSDQEPQGGFSALRNDDKAGYLAVNALLPGVDISETQAARDDALIAGEVEAATEAAQIKPAAPVRKYMNEDG